MQQNWEVGHDERGCGHGRGWEALMNGLLHFLNVFLLWQDWISFLKIGLSWSEFDFPWLFLALSLHMSVCPSPFLPCMEQHEALTRSWADIAQCMLLYFQNCKSKQISFFFKLFSIRNSVIAKVNRLVLKQGTGTVLGKLCWVGHCTHKWQLEREGRWVLDSQVFCLWTSVASHQDHCGENTMRETNKGLVHTEFPVSILQDSQMENTSTNSMTAVEIRKPLLVMWSWTKGRLGVDLQQVPRKGLTLKWPLSSHLCNRKGTARGGRAWDLAEPRLPEAMRACWGVWILFELQQDTIVGY
jgi:hypothetical protein